MNYSDFLSQIRQQMAMQMGGQASVSIQPVLKNNNLRLDGLLILNPGENIAPTIYLNNYYKEYLDGTPMQDIVREIGQVYETHRCPAVFDTDLFRDFRRVKNSIAFRVINHGANTELLEDLPHIHFLDLAVVFYFTIENDFIGSSTALIHNKHMELWDTSADELYSLAYTNTRSRSGCRLSPMGQVLLELAGQISLPDADMSGFIPEITPADSICILSNNDRIFGASCLLYQDILDAFASHIKDDFYIIPSSIHEVILLPRRTSPSPLSLQNMVREINCTEVAPEEILSDNIYIYHAESHKLGLVFLSSGEY